MDRINERDIGEAASQFSDRAADTMMQLRSQAFSGAEVGMGGGSSLPNGAPFTVMNVRVAGRTPEVTPLPSRLSAIAVVATRGGRSCIRDDRGSRGHPAARLPGISHIPLKVGVDGVRVPERARIARNLAPGAKICPF